MRLWSLHPQYLDAKGLVALWREALLAQKVLAGKTRGYKNHPQLTRFKACASPSAAIAQYLHAVAAEAKIRGYHFDERKIAQLNKSPKINVTRGQLDYELQHLKAKLKKRDPKKLALLCALKKISSHPLFKIIPGKISDWEVIEVPQKKKLAANYFVYILESTDGKFYIGYTNNLEKRMKAHAEGKGAKFTRGFGFKKLLYSETFRSKSKAMKREAELKRLSRAEKTALISA